MSETREVTVQITFQPPNRRDSSDESEPHKRVLESVPRAIAAKMTNDLASYREGGVARYQTYNYASRSSEGEALIALDLGEVVNLTVKRDPIGMLEGFSTPLKRPVGRLGGEMGVGSP